MKTNNFMHLMAAAAVFAGMVMFTSCNKDDFELPEVIESEVLDEGLSEEITTESTEQGTKLSYESWIMVKGQTRAAFENKVSVTLNNSLWDVNETIGVGDWVFGEKAKTNLTYEAEGSREEGFVTVIDSVLVYTVSYENFQFAFRLPYQVAVYDDKVTRQVMPYYPYSNLQDLGGEFEKLESVVEDNSVYSLRRYTHRIRVDCKGETYEITANILLQRYIGTPSEPYILSSSLVSETSKLSEDGKSILSFLTVNQKWSTGETQDKTYMVSLSAVIHSELLKWIEISGYKDDLAIQNTYLEDGERTSLAQEDDFVYPYALEQNYVVEYNYFTIKIKLAHDIAIYDDGVSMIDFPSFAPTSFVNDFTFTKGNAGEDEIGPYQWYNLKHRLSANMDGYYYPIDGVIDLNVLVRP